MMFYLYACSEHKCTINFTGKFNTTSSCKEERMVQTLGGKGFSTGKLYAYLFMQQIDI